MLGRLALASSLVFLWLAGISDAAGPANNLPRPPCEGSAYPAFPAPGAAPNVELWTAEALGADWMPPACTGWNKGAALVVALTGQFPSSRDTDAMLARIGAISSLRAVRYWSVTDKAWQSLFLEAAALTAPEKPATRGDFTASDIRGNAPLYFLSADNRSSDGTISRMALKNIAPGHIVLEMTNTSPVRWFWFVVMPAGAMRTLYFLDRQGDGSWRFYSLSRADNSSLLSRFVSRASYINRAVAMYRHMAEIPTDRDPPAAP